MFVFIIFYKIFNFICCLKFYVVSGFSFQSLKKQRLKEVNLDLLLIVKCIFVVLEIIFKFQKFVQNKEEL